MTDKFSFFRYPRFHLDVFVLAGIAAGFCLLAIWVGLSTRHWFLRAAALVLALLALLPIQAHQPALMLALALPLVSIIIALMNRRRIGPPTAEGVATPTRVRFGLKDLLLGVLLAGAVCYGVTILIERREELEWKRAIAGAVSLGTFVGLCYSIAFGRHKPWMGATLLVVVGLNAAVDLSWGIGWGGEVVAIQALLEIPLDMLSDTGVGVQSFACLAYAGTAFSLLLIGLITVYLPPCNRSAGPSSGQWRPIPIIRVARRAAIAVFAIGSAVLYSQMARTSRIGHDESSNSYLELLKIAQRVEALNPTTVALRDATLADDAGKEPIVLELEQAYRAGLRLTTRPGHVPLHSRVLEYDLKLKEMSSFRDLACAWRSQGTWLAENGNLADAANYHVSTIEMGVIVGRKGLIVHALVGSGLESVGVFGLIPIREELARQDAQHVLTRLINIDQSREAAALLAARDKEWVRTSYAWQSRFAHAIETWWRAGKSDPDEWIFRTSFAQRDATLRLLMTDLALRSYQRDQGRLPVDLNALVPGYLPSVPIDAFSDRPLIYRRQGEAFLLYSVGTDGRDDGGKLGTRRGDLAPDGRDWGLDFDEE